MHSLPIFWTSPLSCGKKVPEQKKELDRYLESQGISQSSLNIVARMNDLEAVRRSIVQGIGISVLSYRSARDLADSSTAAAFLWIKYHLCVPFILYIIKTGY